MQLREIGDEFDVSVVSPRNYFLFTPLLPGYEPFAARLPNGVHSPVSFSRSPASPLEPMRIEGSFLGLRDAILSRITHVMFNDPINSIIEPIRSICLRNGKQDIKFYEAKCTKVDVDNNKIFCEDRSPLKGQVSSFWLPYDYLVVAVGAKNNTFGTPGVRQHANFLKSVEDAQKIRSKVVDAFESANLPGQPEEERKRLLRFVVVGGGPTGVEYAAELHGAC
jgi:NADH dehydrogenase FAD-containing subunit